MRYAWSFIAFISFITFVACSSQGSGPAPTDSTRGALGQQPKVDGTCNQGLVVCQATCQQTCVPTATVPAPVPTPAPFPVPMPTTTSTMAPVSTMDPPPPPPPVLAILDVAAFNDTTCVVREVVSGQKQGRVTCWGSDEGGALGQGQAIVGGFSLSKLAVAAGDDVVGLSVLLPSATTVRLPTAVCAVKASGATLCWGPDYGATPKAHAVFTTDVKAIAADCMLRASDGAVVCGSTGLAQVTLAGNNVRQLRVVRADVLAPVSPSVYGYGAVRSDGKVVVWGANTGFRLGVEPAGFVPPTVVPGIDGVIDLALGTQPSGGAAASETGQLFGWGIAGWMGPMPQNGNFEGATNARPGPPSLGSPKVKAVAATAFDTLVITVDSKITMASYAPGGVFPGAIRPAVALAGIPLKMAVSSSHGCVSTDVGKLFCWGENQKGKLGDGSMTDSASPKEVAF
jgi:hypothetical protein